MPDSDAFSRFFVLHERRLRAFALRRARTPAAADELVGAVMEVAWRRFDEIPEESPFGWLCGTAVRLAANEGRRRRRWERMVDRAVAEAKTRPSVSQLGDESLLVEQREAVYLAFRGLSAQDREILRLATWEGLSDVELGAALGISAVSARKRLSRARQRFAHRHAAMTGEHRREGGTG